MIIDFQVYHNYHVSGTFRVFLFIFLLLYFIYFLVYSCSTNQPHVNFTVHMGMPIIFELYTQQIFHCDILNQNREHTFICRSENNLIYMYSNSTQTEDALSVS